MDGGAGDNADPAPLALYARLDAGDAAMRALPTLDERRTAARNRPGCSPRSTARCGRMARALVPIPS